MPGPSLPGGAVVARRVHPGSVVRSGARQRRLAEQPRLRRSAPEAHVAEIQRVRLLAGALGAIEEHGYARTTVAQITARSRVSRRTFYELFENREACLIALLEDVVATLRGELAAAGLGGLAWRERVRSGLWVVLCFCDREPALARLLVDQSSHGGSRVLRRREEVQASLATVLDEGRAEASGGRECSPLTGEGLVGAAEGIIKARLLQRQAGAPLTALLGELMSMIVLPYLGIAAARRERSRPAPASPAADVAAAASRHLALVCDPLEGIPIRMTYRTARVLGVVAAQPGVSNRTVAECAGIQDQGQISKLLARLERLGLAENACDGNTKGEPNAWSLTVLGHQVAQRLGTSIDCEEETA
jgi:AcrR family transcriptional regulator